MHIYAQLMQRVIETPGNLNAQISRQQKKLKESFQRCTAMSVYYPMIMSVLEITGNPSAESEPYWLMLARKEIGTKEACGAEDNPRIIQYHSCCSMRAQSDSVPWCSAFINWVMLAAGEAGTRSAAARSWLNWGIECEAKVGAVVILKRGKEHQGHVGLVCGVDPLFVNVLGGNQDDAVSIKRYLKSNVLGFRWPKVLA
jgi:uncharacterized protein (TIGR02594 family)